ncbi:MAG: hypothetical protein LBS86_03135 [Treponema sp.]|jgi:hypothetical protein|nr:hypothetical protein [Treponema sp.]
MMNFLTRAGICASLLLTVAALTSLAAQDDFGFGFGDEDSATTESFSTTTASPPAVTIAGEVSGTVLVYVDDFDALPDAHWGDIFAGALNFSASAFNAEAVINLNLTPAFTNGAFTFPIAVDEAYARAYFGKLSVEAGLRKLTWGKADSLGPLDVINPLDYSDLTAMTDVMSIKLARPMIHAAYSIGAFSKIEAVFVPWFQGITFAEDGRWAPAQMQAIASAIGKGIASALAQMPPSQAVLDIAAYYEGLDVAAFYPNTTTLKYAQAGARFTTSVGSSDIGAQYYFGRLHRPAVTIVGQDTFLQNPYGIAPRIAYNWYHQVGVDFARVIAGFNLRAELAANLTEDLAGDDGGVYNPSIAWSLGFDRDLFAGINLNLQVNERIRLLNSKVGNNIALDTEAGSDVTSTRITAVLSKKFFRDELELKVTGIVGIEDADFYLLPGVIWTKGDIVLELSGGVFGGDTSGELGQYHRNSFVKTILTYAF